jgi:putative DNA methylase
LDDEIDRSELRLAAYSRLSYEEKVARSLRPEELAPAAYEGIWDEVNTRLRTDARSVVQLVEQLGIMRFGHRPKVGDTFCGAGSIPFEAARLGCDIYASDLNPIACMLTWGALHLIGGSADLQERLQDAQATIAEAVDRQITALGIEHDEEGNRAKAHLYCVEVRCPRTGWLVPLLPSLVISRIKKTIGRLVPDYAAQRLDIVVEGPVSDAELEEAKQGTYRNKSLHYELEGESYTTPLSSIRGDYRVNQGNSGNRLRPWEMKEVRPRQGDIFGERLYCIQWIKAETLHKGRQETFFRTPDEEDFRRERDVAEIVEEQLSSWQESGFVPDMRIEPGAKTDEPIRTRGWTYWHHLFTPRQLLIGALVAEEIEKVRDDNVGACLAFDRTFIADKSSRLSHWRLGSPGREGRAASADGVEHVFYNQALNTFFNYAARGLSSLELGKTVSYKRSEIATTSRIETHECRDVGAEADIWITDPPYADAVNYHEITEFFIAWLRKNPPPPFQNWIWDSRRPLAIKGEGNDFKKAMVDAYQAMVAHMPDNGLQIVMFTHQDARVWADMAQIFWGAGLQVMAAWYVATETSSDVKKGGYVQGTVTIVLRKRTDRQTGFKDEIVQEVKAEVADQIETMVGLNQSLRGHGRVENLFEDADLQMAGYAAALRVLTRYALLTGWI